MVALEINASFVIRDASCQTRHGDWVMRMRLRGEITRKTDESVRP
ncbi:hypothetical protein BLL52_2024 [Rhodoferax antarcticus ANT.BR]|uniref:Uncharacterized protein n=1 Tax=Rhodoferax antarcticus ANT.BR TaxID=1111071 RepID=A0A1Q8YCQ1_9BURK|nr:hypothetical protein BLL52_2024 [Rhodoferax antarcticus ANT.BR]